MDEMDMGSDTDAIKQENLQVDEADDCYRLKITAGDTHGSRTTEYISGDWSAEVKSENLMVVKQEPDDVCHITLYLIRHCRKNIQVLVI